MSAAASGIPVGRGIDKSEGMSSGLVGNIHGQDVEAAKVHSYPNKGPLVY